ncbi:hypothetical protein [Undibacterium parvum]|uniref:Uncharacterized protein n=2 Tax=Undibacterium TaxID=401469 RepID=A0A6M4A5J4_9BURK|nr:hypothetical protein [Undibacterium parvum]AZP12277.1 hypothetical protein EJN92_09865 [Undibacterium parvum]QJQ06561.1 hypothetical protein EJG51_012730 [Undibacterium piscinae]
MTHPQDLHALANKALNQIESDQERQAALRIKPSGRRLWVKVVSTMILVAVVTSIVDSRTLIFWLGVSEQKQLAEMTAALTAAKVAVEQSHSTTGEWPDRVPLPALASLVELQNPGPTYRLLATTQQWQLTMTPSGDLQKAQP